jgi:hypothetical protein
MFAPNNQRTDCIDPDHYDPSPSTGWRGVRAAFHISTKGGEVDS